MTLYKVRPNESPAAIARRFRVSMPALIAANPHKPTKRVGNVTTWQGLRHNESVRLPAGAVGTLGDFLGDAVTDAVSALVAAGGPCLQANVGIVCNLQRALGVGVDGKYGSGTAAAAKARVSSAPAGCSPRPAWWAPPGQSNCPASAPSPTASATPTAPPSGLTAAAQAAAAALSADANYCVSVARVGTAVNTTVHNFKAAWNAANPSRPVPIGTGKYEPVVASALSETLGGAAVPPGCGATASVPTTPAPTYAPPVATRTTMPVTSAAPPAVQALLGINPCDQVNVSIVIAAQKALGLSGTSADGKYGTDTAALARKVLPGAPAGCSPRPAWWAPKGQTNAGSATATAGAAASTAADTAKTAADTAKTTTDPAAATAAASQAAAAAQAAATAAAAAPADQKPAADASAAQAAKSATDAANAAAATGGGSAAITPPEAKKGLSTGAIVVGAVGVAALVGVAAMALSGKKSGHRGARGPRGKSGGHRKPTKHKRKSSTHKKKR